MVIPALMILRRSLGPHLTLPERFAAPGDSPAVSQLSDRVGAVETVGVGLAAVPRDGEVVATSQSLGFARNRKG